MVPHEGTEAEARIGSHLEAILLDKHGPRDHPDRYLLLISFPQVLFGHSTNYQQFKVYSRQPIDEPALEKVLDRAEAKLKASPIYDESVSRRIYLTDSFALYALLSHKAWQSFGNSVPFINNAIVNTSDVSSDLVFLNRPNHNQRSLSGVIAHETTHLFLRQRYGTLTASTMPSWKNEGYCDYVAGESTMPLDEAIALWKANPADDSGYRFAKYHAIVKYLLEQEHLTVDELVTQPLDEKDVTARTLAFLSTSPAS